MIVARNYSASHRSSSTGAMLLAVSLAGTILVSSMTAQSTSSGNQNGLDVQAVPVSTPATRSELSRHARSSPYTPSHFPRRAGIFYGDVWGVDSLTVRATESGELIRFSYRVLNASKAGQLNDKKSQPTLVDPRAGVELVIPSLEKVGQLRQSSIPEEGKVYWMAFSNPGRHVKKGDRVDVHFGSFRAQGLVVD